jgi:hypothetical protein
MPELRLVVLAIQERVAYGQTFDEALTKLLGDKALTEATKPAETPGAGPSSPTQSPSPVPTAATTQQLVLRAIQEFEEYQRLTAQGKLAEAGQKLEQHKRTLEELRRATGKP